MNDYNLLELEAALFRRNPLLEERLRPPLEDESINTLLKKAGVSGPTAQIRALYSWRNGTVFDEILMRSKTGFFPEATYQFIGLDQAINHMKAYDACVCTCVPELTSLASTYFPVFWNGATKWMAFDLRSRERGSVVVMKYFAREASLAAGHYTPAILETTPPRQVYSSFADFVEDAIRANKHNVPLQCAQYL